MAWAVSLVSVYACMAECIVCVYDIYTYRGCGLVKNSDTFAPPLYVYLYVLACMCICRQISQYSKSKSHQFEDATVILSG